MNILLKAGLIAAPGGRFVADLLIHDGWITAIGRTDGSAEHIIDATGHVVMPGWILPFIPFDLISTPPHESYPQAGITCAGWLVPELPEPCSCDFVPMELIESADDLARAPRTIHESGCVAFVIPASCDGRLIDAAAHRLAQLRATLVIVPDDTEESAVDAAKRASACGGRVVVGPLRPRQLLRHAIDAGALPATDPDWLVADPSLWQEVARGIVRLLISSSSSPPGIDVLYRMGPASGLVSMEGLARLIAASPATLLGCATKGLLVPGREADLCLIEPSTGNAVIVQTLLHGSEFHGPNGRIIRAEPVNGLLES